MSYSFAPGVSACRADGRLVILNVRADRYLMLPPESEAALSRLLEARPTEPGDLGVHERLCTNGLVLRRSASPGLALCEHAMPTRSVLDDGWIRPGAGQVALAALRAMAAGAALRGLGFEKTVDRVRRIPRPGDDDVASAARIAAGFAELRLAMRALDRCLPLSVALAAAARRRHGAIRLVLGVSCHPFCAHAWVQLGSTVLNDRLDTVGAYTPVLVV